MSRKAPIAVESANVAEHPAARAWTALGGDAPVRVELWRRARSKPGIYRLIFANPRRPAVFAKQSQSTAMALELMIYQDILSRMPGTAPRFLGSCVDPDGFTWLFVEGVGDRKLSEDNPAHRVLAARWLGQFHRSAAGQDLATRLPDAGPGRYLGHLRAGRDAIRRHFANPGFAAEDLALLSGVLEELDALEARWPEIESACDGMPVTLVHGDLRPKNVRIRSRRVTPALYAIDWEMAGWGVPAADLAGACGPGPTLPIASKTYLESMREQWGDLDASDIRSLSSLGRIFQALAGIDWAGASLKFDTRRYLLAPVSTMRVHRGQIANALGERSAWLG
jgi:aminoglycoside phosphotransferase (APT) family kinase protein